MQAIFSVRGARGRHDNRRACCLVQILLEEVIHYPESLSRRWNSKWENILWKSRSSKSWPIPHLSSWSSRMFGDLARGGTAPPPSPREGEAKAGHVHRFGEVSWFFKSIIQFIFWLCDKAAKEKGGGPLMVQSLQSPRCELTQLRSWSMHWTLCSLSRSSCWVLEMISALLSINTVQWQREWYWQQQ